MTDMLDSIGAPALREIFDTEPLDRDATVEIDLYCDEPAEFIAKLERGDDFAHWTLRYGCVLFDSGALCEAAAEAAERAPSAPP